ncbi:LysR family transcriptional regulator [Lachnospiraceae bacterium C1.1]|nr:LysR family transcriptional regulator [Lachnospiraceae bacterium C1.1]
MINYIKLIIEEGSITDAAKKLNISQPALSAKVKKIEEDYGIEIFRKNRRPLCLTEEGERYVKFFDEYELIEREFKHDISDLRNLKTGYIKIGGPQLYTIAFLPEAIERFRKLYPDVKIEIVNDSAPELSEMLMKRKLDLFVSNPGKKEKKFCYEAVADIELLLCVPKKFEINKKLKDYAIKDLHKKSDFKTADIKDFDGLPFAMLRSNQHMGASLRKILRDKEVEPSNIIETDQAITAYALTAAGTAISVMYDRALCYLGNEADDVCFYRIADRKISESIYLVHLDQPENPAVDEFVKCFRQVMDQ